MLGKRLRKHLCELKDWDKAVQKMGKDDGEHTNPSKLWKDTLNHGETAIRDLSLLNATLPEEKQAQLFDMDNLRPLINQFLGFHGKDGLDYTIFKTDTRKMMLASMMADASLKYCSILYAILEPVEEFAKLNLNMIDQTRSLVRLLHSKATTAHTGKARKMIYASIKVVSPRKKRKDHQKSRRVG